MASVDRRFAVPYLDLSAVSEGIDQTGRLCPDAQSK